LNASKQKLCLPLRYELYHLFAFVPITRSEHSASIAGAGKQSVNENVPMKSQINSTETRKILRRLNSFLRYYTMQFQLYRVV